MYTNFTNTFLPHIHMYMYLLACISHHDKVQYDWSLSNNPCGMKRTLMCVTCTCTCVLCGPLIIVPSLLLLSLPWAWHSINTTVHVGVPGKLIQSWNTLQERLEENILIPAPPTHTHTHTFVLYIHLSYTYTHTQTHAHVIYCSRWHPISGQTRVKPSYDTQLVYKWL